MLIADIHHVSINVDDLGEARDFYVEVLGLPELPRPDLGIEGYWLDAGNGRQVHLIQSDAVPRDVGQHFAFRVTDIAAARASLVSRHVVVSDIFQLPGGPAQCFLHDPSGNRVEFTQT